MGAIGNYIHYHAENYDRYGINTVQSKKLYSYKSQKENILKKARQKLKKFDIKTFDKGLNEIFGSEVKSQAVLDVRQAVEEQLEKRFGETLQTIDWTTGDVKFKGDGLITSKYKPSKDKNNNIILDYNKIKSKIDILNQIRQSFLKEIMDSEGLENYQKLNDILQKIEKIMKELVIDIDKGMNNKGIEKQFRKQKYSEKEALVRYLNEAISEYAAYPAISLQKGDLFEYVVGYAPHVAFNTAIESLNNNINEIVVGTSGRFTNIINPKFFSKDIIFDKDLTQSIGASQGKIDVSFKWKGQKNMSIKNINFKKKYATIHLLSGSPLLFMIQDEDSDFVNHFLNVNSTMPRKYEYGLKKSLVNEEMKLALFYKALTGDVYKKKMANIFIVNDNSTGKVRTYSMIDIIEKASKNIDAVTVQVGGTNITYKDFRLLSKYNQKDTPEQRINKILNVAHSKKVHSSMSVNFLLRK